MKKRRREKIKPVSEDLFESDEYFYMIIGYTSNDVPYGVTWEQAKAEGLVEHDEEEDSDLPF